MQTLAVYGNPRRRARKSGKRRSAAQRAATARMLAANRSARGSAPKRRRAKRRTSVVSAAPRRSVRRVSRRSVRRSARRMGSSLRSSGIVGMLKSGLVGGAGAIGVDVAMGYVAPMLPASMQTPVDPATGGINYGYVGVKAAIAIAVGHFGRRISPEYAPQAANGALTVLAYQLLRPMVPASVTLGRVGNINPAPTMRPRLSGMNAYVSGVGAYQNVRSIAPARRGSGAANAMNMVTRRQDAA